MSPSKETIKDFFISYSGRDAEFVAKLTSDLNSAGVKVWWDKTEMKVGDSLHQKIQDGISNAAWLGVVLSPNSVSSAWVEKELSSALARELESRQVFVLPILYRDCQVPLFLKDKVYADFRTSYDLGLETLLERIDPPIKPQILKKLTSGNPAIIAACFAGIKVEQRRSYCDVIVNMLASSSVSEKIAALTGLFVIRHKDLTSHLLRMAKDSSASVRRFSVFYLGEMRASYAIGIVSELLSDKSPEVRSAAREAYKKVGGPKLTTE
jgi:hypothetical protein